MPVNVLNRAHFNTPASAFPDATNTGPTQSFLTTSAGSLFATAADITGHVAFAGGAGTVGSPYLISRHRFTDGSVVGDFDPGTLTGKYLRFSQCEFGGTTTTGDLDALAPPLGIGVNARTAALPARVTLDDCRLAPASGSPVAAGGPNPATGGLGFVLRYDTTPVDLNRCDVWGGACNIAVVNVGAAAPRSTWTDCWLHDQWVSGGAHTDNINGADPTNASNITVEHCTVDGKCGQRSPARVVNNFGIYNTVPITGWVINRCLIRHADFGIFWAPGGTGGAITSMTVANNTFDLSDLGSYFSGQLPTVSGGNVDQNGSPLAL